MLWEYIRSQAAEKYNTVGVPTTAQATETVILVGGISDSTGLRNSNIVGVYLKVEV